MTSVSTTVTDARDDVEPQDIWSPILATFLFNFLVYIFAQFKKDNSIVDIFWGLLFIVALLTSLLVSMNWNERTILVFSLVVIWGLRLAFHIGVRHTNGEDFRYKEMRDRWEPKGKCYYYIVALMFVYMLQAFVCVIVNSSALFVAIWSGPDFYWLDALGAFIWLLGFATELIADWQLMQFRNN